MFKPPLKPQERLDTLKASVAFVEALNRDGIERLNDVEKELKGQEVRILLENPELLGIEEKWDKLAKSLKNIR